MTLNVPSFVQEFTPGTIHFSRGSAADLGSVLENRGIDRVLVVCGSNVGSNRDVMDRIEAGLGTRLIDVFDQTTPAKEIETAYDGVDRIHETGVDALVAVGGGSSIDVAKVMSALHADYRTLKEIQHEIQRSGNISAPDNRGAVLPVFPVPTTLAGAELNPAGGILVPTEHERVGVLAEGLALKPPAVFYDPDLFETTPTDPLIHSAMNGFDKGIEALYSRHANPLTDAMAVRGLEYFRSSLPRLGTTDQPSVIERIVAGLVLVQHGCSVGNSIIHSFGHGLRRHFGVHQGLAHAVMAPHALRLLFDEVNGRRKLLARALIDGEAPSQPATAVIESVTDTRDMLGLPSRLRELDPVSKEGLTRVAELTYNDPNMENAPQGFTPTVAELRSVLHDAW